MENNFQSEKFIKRKIIKEEEEYNAFLGIPSKVKKYLIPMIVADYYTGNYSFRQLSKKYNISIANISYHFKKNGIKISSRNEKFERDYAYWATLKKEGRSEREISRLTGMKSSTITYFFRKVYPKWVESNPEYRVETKKIETHVQVTPVNINDLLQIS